MPTIAYGSAAFSAKLGDSERLLISRAASWYVAWPSMVVLASEPEVLFPFLHTTRRRRTNWIFGMLGAA